MKSLVGAVCAMVLSAPALAAPFQFEIIESLAADWHWTLDDPQILDPEKRKDVIDLRNRLNVRARTGEWSFGLRLDAAWFPNAPSAQYQDDVRIEEVFATWRTGKWTLTAGDDYLTVGRGLALSLRKFDEVGVASSLRGFHASYRTPGLRFRLGAGTTNVVNVDMVEEKYVPDPNDLVLVGRIETDAIEKWRFGAHVVDIERRHSDLRNAISGLYGDDDDEAIYGRRFKRSLIVGANAEATRLWDKLDLYGEFGYLFSDETRESIRGEEPAGKDGLALYGSASLDLGRVGVLLEGKHYDHWDVSSSLHPATATAQGITQSFTYIAPPSLERTDQRVINTTDVSGVRLKLDYRFPQTKKGDRNVVFLNNAFFVDAPAQDEWTYHGYAGWERQTQEGERLSMQFGHRLEEAPEAGGQDGSGITRLSMWHLDIDWTKTVAKGVDIQLHWNNEIRSKNINAPTIADSYYEGTFYMGFNLPPQWSLTLQMEYLTEAGNEQPYFPGAFLQWKPEAASFVRLFVGKSKGGLKCSGGVCRVFPDFEGVKLETTFRF